MLQVTHGSNDLIFTGDGSAYIDLISSTGAVFLGHANERVNRRLIDQLSRISCSWTSAIDVEEECRDEIGRRVDPRLSLHRLYSSGTEAAEVAMRVACYETGRSGIIGFRGNHHGRSVAVQNITGPELELPRFDSFVPIPFIPGRTEAEILDDVAVAVSSDDIAAIFLEPLQGRGGGYSASAAFYEELQRIVRAHGVLVICDEIFSGAHRTGPWFRYPALGIRPDIVLIGKAIANGFPAAGVLLDERFAYHPKDLRLGSTFANNPLACAAVLGTLAEMDRIDVEDRVAQVERTLAKLDAGPRVNVRLHGAACFVELPSLDDASVVQRHLQEHRILALQRGAVIGLWPPATITDEHLLQVVEVTNDVLATIR